MSKKWWSAVVVLLVCLLGCVGAMGEEAVPEGLEYSHYWLETVPSDDEEPIYHETYGIVRYTGNTSELVIPNRIDGIPVTDIALGAFLGCNSLVSVKLPSELTTICAESFMACENLTMIEIPNSVRKIGDYCFVACNKLNSLHLPEGLEMIGSVGRECKQLTSIYLPGSLKTVTAGTISECERLKCITIGEGIEKISNYAFYDVPSLEKIYFSKSVQTIELEFDSKCHPLVVCYENTPADYWAISKHYDVCYRDEANIEDIGILTAPKTMDVYIGTPLKLDVMLNPYSDETRYSFESKDKDIAFVDEDGVLHGVSLGKTTITASVVGHETMSKQIIVSVHRWADEISFIDSERYILLNTTEQLEYTLMPNESTESVTLVSSAPQVVQVHENGIYGSSVGDATVSVTLHNGKTATCTVHVCYPVTAVDFASATTMVPIDGDVALNANVTMRDQQCINHLVTFISSNETIATVDGKGVVHGVSAGKTTIKAIAQSGVGASCTVTVADIRLTPSAPAAHLAPGDAARIAATILPQEAAVSGFTMTTSNPAVVAVDGAALRAVGAGTATLTLTAVANPLATATVTVTVAHMPTFTLPANMTTVGAEAFTGTAAQAVVIPAGVTSIGAGAFTGCTALQTVRVLSLTAALPEGALDADVVVLCKEDSAALLDAIAAGQPYLLLD